MPFLNRCPACSFRYGAYILQSDTVHFRCVQTRQQQLLVTDLIACVLLVPQHTWHNILLHHHNPTAFEHTLIMHTHCMCTNVLCRSERFLAFPIGFDIEAEDLIRKLLTPNPTFRLGNLSGGVRDIMDHPWFSNNGFNWQQVCELIVLCSLLHIECACIVDIG
jgi:hypothetical protein